MTVEPVEATLSHAQFKALGTAAGLHSPLSAFHPVADAPTAPLPVEMLLNGQPVIEPRWSHVAAILGHADRCGAVTYSGPEGAIQTTVYGMAGDETPVMVRNAGDQLIVTSPALVGETVWLMRQLVGNSAVSNGRVELELPTDQARTLFAVLDGARRHSLRVMACDREPGPAVADFAEVMTATTASDPSVWLAPYSDQLLGFEALNADELAAGLTALQAQGLLRVEANKVVLGQAVELLLDNLLMVEGHFHFRATQLRDDGITDLVEIRVLRGTTGSFVLWSVFEGVVSISAVSGLVLCELAARFLSGPELIIASTMG